MLPYGVGWSGIFVRIAVRTNKSQNISWEFAGYLSFVAPPLPPHTYTHTWNWQVKWHGLAWAKHMFESVIKRCDLFSNFVTQLLQLCIDACNEGCWSRKPFLNSVSPKNMAEHLLNPSDSYLLNMSCVWIGSNPCFSEWTCCPEPVDVIFFPVTLGRAIVHSVALFPDWWGECPRRCG